VKYTLGWFPLFLLIVGVAAVAVACAAAIHNGCFHPPPPVTRPDPGTPRGEYCKVVVFGKSWALLVLGPCSLVLLAAAVFRRASWLVVSFALVVCLILLANAVAANSLTSALTI
jgi:hypothetical protein